MIDPSTGLDLDSQNAALTPQNGALPAQPALDPNAAAQKQALAQALAKMQGGGATPTKPIGGQMVSGRYVAPGAAAIGANALQAFAPALMAFMKRPAVAAPVAQAMPVAGPAMDGSTQGTPLPAFDPTQ